ncbi:hypothetical protein GCM10023166_13100 [Paeniglutamicibacter cryotolerans]
MARAGWWALDYLYAGSRQIVSVFRRRPPESYAHGDPLRPVIVLLPGVYESWLFLEPAAALLNTAGWRVFSVPGLGFNVKPIPESAGLLAEELARLQQQGVSSCIFLAHSKGGLIGKRAMLDAHQTHGGMAVLGMVAIGTPFSGSEYARYMPTPSLRHFSPMDKVLLSLQEQTILNSKVVSIYPEFDPHIPAGSALTGALNVQVPVSGHFRTLSQAAVLDEVVAAVRTFERESAG